MLITTKLLNGASPRPRGWTPVRVFLDPMRVGFPAPAGMDPLSRPPFGVCRRLPRARGDGPVALSKAPMR